MLVVTNQFSICVHVFLVGYVSVKANIFFSQRKLVSIFILLYFCMLGVLVSKLVHSLANIKMLVTVYFFFLVVYVYIFGVDVNIVSDTTTEEVVGIDLGIKNTIYTSNVLIVI